jgi:hypothetical protein
MIADATPRLVAGRSATLATLVGARSWTVAHTAARGASSRSSTAGRTSRAATGTATLRPVMAFPLWLRAYGQAPVRCR